MHPQTETVIAKPEGSGRRMEGRKREREGGRRMEGRKRERDGGKKERERTQSLDSKDRHTTAYKQL